MIFVFLCLTELQLLLSSLDPIMLMQLALFNSFWWLSNIHYTHTYTIYMMMMMLSCSVMSHSWDSMDCSPPSSSVRGILQARILEWVAMPSSKGSFWPRNRTQVSYAVDGFFAICITREAYTYIHTHTHTHTPPHLYPFICKWTFRWLPCLAILNSAAINIGVHGGGGGGLIAQSCLTLCNPMNCSPPGSSAHGIFQTRILKWVAIWFSR